MSTFAHWKLNDNLATTNVINEKGLDGTLTNAGNTSAISESGKIDRALHFAPTNDLVNVGLSSMACGEGSFACWIKADDATPSSNSYFLGRNDPGAIVGDVGFRLTTAGLIQFFGTSTAGSLSFYSDSALGDTNWHWVMVTWDGSVTKMYIDNVLQTNTGSAFILEAHAGGKSFVLGNSLISGALGWDGLLEDVRLYDYEISSAERTFIYNSGDGIYDEYDEDYVALVQYKCNDNASNSTVTDSSANALNGIMVNDENNYTSEQSIVGKINDAFDFDGANDYITLNDVSPKLVERNVSIGFWCKPNQASGYGRIVSVNTSSAGSIFQAGVSSSDGYFDVYDGTGHRGSTAINNNAWHYIYMEIDVKNQTFKVYIDNAVSADISFSFTNVISSTDLFSLCQEYDSGPVPSDFYKGGLDDVRIFNYLLTTDSRNFLYSSGSGTEDSLPIHKLLETTTKQYATNYQNQRKIVKTSTGTLVAFILTATAMIKYTYSSDNGETWSTLSSDIYSPGTSLNDFDVIIDASDNIYVAISRYHSSYYQTYFVKLTKQAGNSWSTGSTIEVYAQSTTSCFGSTITKRSNGDLWIINGNGNYALFNYYKSTDDGANWSTRVTETLDGGKFLCGNTFLMDDNVCFLVSKSASNPAYNRELRFYEYDHSGESWSYTLVYDNDDIVSSKWNMSSLKISDTSIYTSISTSSGIKVFHWDGVSWDAGTLASSDALDLFPSLSVVNNKLRLVYRTPSTPEGKFVYRTYADSTWSSATDITDGSVYVMGSSLLESSPTALIGLYQRENSSPYDIYFYSIYLGTETLTIDMEETLGFSDLIELTVSNETININETLGFSDDNIIDIPTIGIEESLGFSDLIELIVSNETININETLGFSDTVELIEQATIDEASQIISYNPLVIITDTDPVTIAKVDVSSPATPTWDKYIINLPAETVTNAKDIKYNDVYDVLYITCADGQLLQVNIDDYLDREQIDTGDSNDLQNIELISDVHKVYASTDDADGEIILMEDAEIKALNSDLRLIKVINSFLSTTVNLTDSGSLSSDLRLLTETQNLMSTDLRVLAYDYEVFDLIKRTDFHVHIDDVETTDVKLDSILVRHLQEKSTANFILGRRHDALNVTVGGVPSVITSQNVVKIYIKTKLEFEGTIDRLACDSEAETVGVSAVGSVLKSLRNTVSLPLSTLDTQLHPYDVLVNNPEIYNPVIDEDDANPEAYKGIEVDLGTKINQTNSRLTGLYDISYKIDSGTWNPRQNWEYFFKARAELLVEGRDPEILDFQQPQTILKMATPRYIGTSPSVLSANTWYIHSLSYWRQRVGDDVERELGYYRVGSAPYKLVSCANGALHPVTKWEDKDDGLYYTRDAGYNYEEYCKQIADLEYEKIQNINGDILPQTNVNLSLTIDGYVYYSPSLLTRINITNTTTENIYKNINGFPVAVKSIDISSSTMSVSLRADNAKSNEELQEIEDRKPDADDYTTSEKSGCAFNKFDPNRWEEVQ